MSRTERSLVVSDGSEVLRFLDPDTFQVIRTVTVTDNGGAVKHLNELEMIHGTLYANGLFSNQIVLINPEDGVVTGRIDLSRLDRKSERNGRLNVLNGIAYDAERQRLFVTSELSPESMEINNNELM